MNQAPTTPDAMSAMSDEQFCDGLHKAASAVYLATTERVADDLSSKLAEAARRLRARAADTQRLDWLEKHVRNRVGLHLNGQPKTGLMETDQFTVFLQGEGLLSREETARAAIDAALAATTPPDAPAK